MLNGIDNQEVKKIDAVAHATDVGYDPIPKNRGADVSTKRSQIKRHNHKRQHDMAGGSPKVPDQRPEAQRERIPNESAFPFFPAGDIKIAD